MNQRVAVATLTDAVVANIEAGRFEDVPFYHLEFEKVFPDDVYAQMIDALPVPADYRPLPGHKGGNINEDGSWTRFKIDLFPEFTRHLPEPKRQIWDMVGRALCSSALQSAFMQRLAPGLARRFGKDFAGVGMYPIPILTRDVPGYRINPHTDSRWKGITVQFYLPRDNSQIHIGTIFNSRTPAGEFPKVRQMKFAPNSGYAFAVSDDTWHSADPVGKEVKTRDSILLTYFVDSGLVRFLRNRGKRVGNAVLNEVRSLAR
jgi:hypothetical protein